MAEKYSIVDGRTEAVMWIVYKDGKCVIEKRPSTEQGESVCIPAGHIDLNRDKGNYVESAFLRESSEEFASGRFKPVKYEFLKVVDFEEPNKKGGLDKFRLHYFYVTGWEGEVPKYTTEHGKKHADLAWFPVKKYKELPQSCDREALEELLKRISE